MRNGPEAAGLAAADMMPNRIRFWVVRRLESLAPVALKAFLFYPEMLGELSGNVFIHGCEPRTMDVFCVVA